MKRDSFVFYRGFADGIKCLSDEDQLKALWNIIDYALDGEPPTHGGIAEAIFNMAKPQIDINTKRYQNGCKGGRPKNQTETKSEPSKKQKKTKGEPNKTTSEPNVNDNDNVNIYIKHIVEFLNEKCHTNYRTSTEKTRSLIRARLNEKYTVQDFEAVIAKKADEWLGTEQEKYLRPETLFGNKFESYLQQKSSKPKNSFQNFNQRENIDYDSLQKRLIEKSMKK